MRTRLTTQRAVRAVAVMVTSAALAVGGLVGLAPQASAVFSPCPSHHVTRVASPGDNLADVIHLLCAGDTLKLLPGTYVTGYLRFYKFGMANGGIRPGTPSAPITITAYDPAKRPLLVGGLQFSGADYWHISHLRVQATLKTYPALKMMNGIGWDIRSSDFFGARQTGAVANVAFTGDNGQPSRFVFAYNTVHDAANVASADYAYHNIYVAFHGGSGSGGVITRNAIWSSPRGAGIKLGDGGLPNAPGPWGVKVTNNTIYNSAWQIVLHGNIRYNTIAGNLFVVATLRFSQGTTSTQVSVHQVSGAGNVIHHNYGYAATTMVFDPTHRVYLGTGNRQYNDAAHNPTLRASGWNPIAPTNVLAQAYGASGSITW